MKIQSFIISLGAAACLVFSSCTSVDDRINTKLPEVEEKWENAFKMAYEGLDEVELESWDQAISMIFEFNHHIKEAISDAYFTDKERAMVWRRMLPEVVFAATFNKSLKDMDNIDADDVLLVANGFLQLPNPIEVRAKLLAAQLQHFRSSIGGQLLLREYHAKLYRLYNESLELGDLENDLVSLRYLIAELEGIDSEKLDAAKLQEKRLSLSFAAAKAAQQTELGDLFGNPAVSYSFGQNFFQPEINYAGVERSYEDLVVFGELLKTEAATMLVGLDLGELGIKIDAWPRLRSYTSVPSLWAERNNGTENFGNIQDATIGNTVTWSTDFRGNRALRKERAFKKNDIIRDKMDIQIQERANRLMLLQKEGIILTAEKKEIIKQLETLKEFENSPVKAVRTKAHDGANSLGDALATVNKRLDEINMTFWTLDDSQWGALSEFNDGIFALEL